LFCTQAAAISTGCGGLTFSVNARNTINPWLHRFVVLAAVATWFLIWIGGLVTSHGVGMAVPDWPTTFGYNMFFFPISKWVGGIFYEHTHRLVASGVGFLTIILAVWLWLKEERRWLRWLGVVALFLVILQGVLGGLRVVQMKDAIGIFHATLAQLFFATVCAIALFSSCWWQQTANFVIYDARRLRYLIAFITVLILAQLILGASMRHQHAGLAIPDFPLAYGRLWPATDPDSVGRYNQLRLEVNALNPITAAQVALQMAHRLLALVIFFTVAWASGATVRRAGWKSSFGRVAVLWLALLLAQVVLGASVIWTNKAADVATAHVAVGALSLATGVLLTLMLSRSLQRDAVLNSGPRSSPSSPRGASGRPAGVIA
jgi:cytochrome c oxidase assembly protein subunit 15